MSFAYGTLSDNENFNVNSLIVNPRNGPMTLGTIFTCAVAGGYASRPVYGIVLTARCDISHDKALVVNYLQS